MQFVVRNFFEDFAAAPKILRENLLFFLDRRELLLVLFLL